MSIKNIQNYLIKNNIDATIITHNNHFLRQDILPAENKIMQLTGFSGSYAILVVTKKNAHLLTDSRYQIQANLEVDTSTIQIPTPQTNHFVSLIESELAANAVIEYNPWHHSIEEINSYKKAFPLITFAQQNQISPTNSANVFIYEQKYSGLESCQKLELLQKEIKNNECQATFISLADSVSWLTNLRSNALEHSPIIRAFALVTLDKSITLFADNLNMPANHHFRLLPTSAIADEFKNHQQKTFYLPIKDTSHSIKVILDKLKIKQKISNIDICQSLKAIKNPTEIKGFIDAHIKDGVALCQFLYWIKDNWQEKSELDIVSKLLELRKKQASFYANSFATIAGFASNGAIIHYKPSAQSNKKLQANNLLLIDSGAHYLEATTDVTRTIAIGTPTPQMIQKFTLVLKSHISLANSKFPLYCNGSQLDAICRRYMWQQGLDYAHGTGHGVGCFLNVHEGPQNISPRDTANKIKDNIVFSIEPGYYSQDNFGIRIENLAYTKICDSDFEQKMLKFVPLTLVPIDKSLINKDLLNKEEINWINQYHQNIYNKISTYLDNNQKLWLKDACSSL